MAPHSLPVWYEGREYRSVTEAKYAKLLDELGIKFDYETQGFNADGTWYLPDFLIFPALGMLWAEVKGSWEQDPKGIARWRKFSLWRPARSRSALLAGEPTIGNRALVMGGDPDEENAAAGAWEDDTFEWRPCPSGQHFDLTWPGQFRSKFAEDGCPYTDQEGYGTEKLERAIQVACSFRFDRKPPSSPEAA